MEGVEGVMVGRWNDLRSTPAEQAEQYHNSALLNVFFLHFQTLKKLKQKQTLQNRQMAEQAEAEEQAEEEASEQVEALKRGTIQK